MKLKRILGMAVATSFVASMAVAGTSSMNFAEKFEKECQGCHGPIHQGGVGSDLRPKALKKKSKEFLAERILNGVENSIILQWVPSKCGCRSAFTLSTQAARRGRPLVTL